MVNKQLVLAITGGGSEAIGALLSQGGASSYFLEGIVPYSNHALGRFLGTKPTKAVSEMTARMMANAAYDRAEDLSPQDITTLVGVGVTASLGKAEEREGRDHVAFVSVRTYDRMSVAKWNFKHPRTRKEEENMLTGLILATVNEVVPESVDVADTEFNKAAVLIDEFEYIKAAKDDYKISSLGKYETVIGKPIGHRPAIFPGSFNPIHAGHIAIVKHMAQKLQKPIYLELSIGNVDKLSLDIIDVDERLHNIKSAMKLDRDFGQACAGVILSAMPTFYEKLWTYNSPEFILGTDTALRLFDSKYGESSFAGTKSDALIDLCCMNTKPIFHVLNRPGYNLPEIKEEVVGNFNIVDDFVGANISSTEIRKTNGIS